jgi:hypothetical protein
MDTKETKEMNHEHDLARLKAELARADKINLILSAKLANDYNCCAEYKPAICGRCSGLCHLAEAERSAAVSSGIPTYGQWRTEVLDKLALVGRLFEATETEDYEVAAQFDLPVYRQRRADSRSFWLGFAVSQDGNNVKVTVWEHLSRGDKNSTSLWFSLSDKSFAAHACHSTLYVAKNISNVIGMFET